MQRKLSKARQQEEPSKLNTAHTQKINMLKYKKQITFTSLFDETLQHPGQQTAPRG